MKKSLLCFTLFCYTAKLFSSDINPNQQEQKAIWYKNSHLYFTQSLLLELTKHFKNTRCFILWNRRGSNIPYGPMNTILQYYGISEKSPFRSIPRPFRTTVFQSQTVEQIEEHFNQADREAPRRDIPE